MSKNGGRREEPAVRRCSFCRRWEADVEQLISSPDGAAICDECVAACHEILAEGRAQAVFRSQSADSNVGPLSPKSLYDQLGEWVVGQEQARRVLSVAVYNHYKRIAHQSKVGNVELEKSNILLIGPTGCGKTLLAQTLARILDVPFCIADATALTEAGYVGEDVETILLRLIQAADYDIGRAAKGIVYIDEIDKTARKNRDNPSITRDVSGEGVQQALLKIIEGTIAHVPPYGGRKHPHQEFIQLNTSNILFICGGTFDGLAEIVARRVGIKGTLGFAHVRAANERSGKNASQLLQQVNADDLVQYGMIPELIGRLPVTVSVEPLDLAAVKEILTRPRNALVKQYQQLFTYDQVELVFTDDAIDVAAQEALRRETGARGLRAIVEEVLLDVMYEVPSRSDVSRVIVNADAILHRARPILLNEADNVVPWGDHGFTDAA